MALAWIIFLLAAGWAVWLAARHAAQAPRLVLALIALAGVTVAGAYRASSASLARKKIEDGRVERMPVGDRGEGFVRSDSCVSCHPREHETWHKSFHRTMTQVSSPETALGKFDGVELEWAGSRYKLDRDQEGLFVEMDDPHGQGRLRLGETAPARRIKARTGLLTGSHHMQVCWVSLGGGKTQLLLPFAWLAADQRWVPFDQTFLRDPALPHSMQVWNNNCGGCHSTAPRPLYEPAKGTVRTTAGELGIACEACHGPGEAHVQLHRNPVERYAARFTAAKSTPPEARLVNPAKLDSKRASDVCGQCHSIKWFPNYEAWNRDGLAFSPGMALESCAETVRPTQMANQDWVKGIQQNPRWVRDRYWPDGMARVSGREFNGLVESPCYIKGELSCLSCHSMHASPPDDQLAARMDGNEACLQCHGKFRESLEAHTHHPAGSAGSLCYNCHMPYTTYGLLKGIRSHQITSPDIAVARQTGRPDACTACHLDKSLGWASTNLAGWFNHPIPALNADENELPAAAARALKGDAGQRALAAHAMGWKDAQAASGTNWLAPYLRQLLDDPYPAVRYVAHRSLRTLPEYREFPFDFTIPPAQRALVATNAFGPGPELRMSPAKYLELLQARDNLSIDLQE